MEYEAGRRSSRSASPRFKTYVVINRDTQGALVVKILRAVDQIEAVNTRQKEIGGKVIAVSRSLPGEYGTGATRLYPVIITPPTPPVPIVRVSSQHLRLRLETQGLEDAF